MKEQWIVEGIMPERAIERLQKAGICVEQAKKIEKRRILFCINKKDCEKAFAIYPNMCYNNKRESVYSFRRVGEKSVREKRVFRSRLAGAALGVCLFSAFVAYASTLVLRIELVGADVYQREVVALLKEEGVRLYAPYRAGKEDALAAKILTLDGVEFCSVQKYGNAVKVEIRTNVFSTAKRETGALVSPTDATVLSAVSLGGTLLVEEGKRVSAGETLIGEYFLSATGEKISAIAVGKVKLLCESALTAENEEEARIEGRLLSELLGGEFVGIERIENGALTVKYTLVVKKNM